MTRQVEVSRSGDCRVVRQPEAIDRRVLAADVDAELEVAEGVSFDYSGGRLPGRNEVERGRRRGREEKDKSGFLTSRKGQGRRQMPSQPHKEQLGKVSSKAGLARKLKTKKRTKKKSGKRMTRWCGRREVGGGLGTKTDGRKLFTG